MQLMDFLNAGTDPDIKSVPMRCLKVGWSFFILIAIAAYTANLAAFLTTESRVSAIDSLEAAVKANAKICTMTALLDTLKTIYPEASALWVAAENYPDVIRDYMSGKCQAVAVVETHDLREEEWADVFCEAKLKFVDTPLFLIPVAWPAVSEVVLRTLGHHIRKHAIVYSRLMEKIMAPIRERCPEPRRLSQANLGGDETTPLDIVHFSGPIVFCTVAAMCAVLTQLLKSGSARYQERHPHWMDERLANMSSVTSKVRGKVRHMIRRDTDWYDAEQPEAPLSPKSNLISLDADNGAEIVPVSPMARQSPIVHSGTDMPYDPIASMLEGMRRLQDEMLQHQRTMENHMRKPVPVPLVFEEAVAADGGDFEMLQASAQGKTAV